MNTLTTLINTSESAWDHMKVLTDIIKPDLGTSFIYINPHPKEAATLQYLYDYYEAPTKTSKVNGLLGFGECLIADRNFFTRLNDHSYKLIKRNSYGLIINEPECVVEQYLFSLDDAKLLKDVGLITVHPDGTAQQDGTVHPNGTVQCNEYRPKTSFDEFLRLALAGCLTYSNGMFFKSLYPLRVFRSFKKIYVLSKECNSQLEVYMKHNNIPYGILPQDEVL